MLIELLIICLLFPCKGKDFFSMRQELCCINTLFHLFYVINDQKVTFHSYI